MRKTIMGILLILVMGLLAAGQVEHKRKGYTPLSLVLAFVEMILLLIVLILIPR